jgi:hypothetical protein
MTNHVNRPHFPDSPAQAQLQPMIDAAASMIDAGRLMGFQ